MESGSLTSSYARTGIFGTATDSASDRDAEKNSKHESIFSMLARDATGETVGLFWNLTRF